MASDPVTAVLDIGNTLISHFFPDPAQADAAKLKLLELQQSGGLAEMTGQLEVDKVEAASQSLFVAGPRPFIMWVCGVALAAVYIPKAVVLTAIWTYQAVVVVHLWSGTGAPPALPLYPDLGVTDLIGLMGSLLGLAGMRSYDKTQGTSNGH